MMRRPCFHFKSIRRVSITVWVDAFSSNAYHQVGRLSPLALSCHPHPHTDPNNTQRWVKQRPKVSKSLSERFLWLDKINRKDYARYQCLSTSPNQSASLDFPLNRGNLLSYTFPSELVSSLHIEFQSSINQLKLGGHIQISCSSWDDTPVRWLFNKQTDGVFVNDSYLSIDNFSIQHYGYYQCENDQARKTLALSPTLLDLIQSFDAKQKHPAKYNISFIEIIRGKFVGDNITLICRIGQGKNADEPVPFEPFVLAP